MRDIRGLVLLLPFCATLFLFDLDGIDLWSAHEARAAQNAQRMIDDNSWGLPRLYDGQPDLQKPPAFYWLVAAVAAANDGVVNRWSVRLPAALAGALTVLMVYFHLARQGRPIAALVAGIVLTSAVHFTSTARTGRIDMPLTCAVTAAVLLLISNRKNSVRQPLAGLLIGSAILLKGPIGLALPVAVTMAIRCRRRLAGAPQSGSWSDVAIASGIGLLLAAPWFIWADRLTGGEFFRVFFWHHNVGRAMGDSPALAVHPWWYYAPRFAADFLPWTPVLFVAAVWAIRNRCLNLDDLAACGLVWMVVVIGLLSLSQFKRADYLLPAYPGAAIFLGCVVESWYRRLGPNWRRTASSAFLASVPLCLAGWGWFHYHGEPQPAAVRAQAGFARHVREQAPAPATVLLFRVESHLLAFHLGRPIHTLVEWGELNDRLGDPGTHYFVTRAEFTPECREHVKTRRIEVVARSENFTRVAPLRPLVLMRTIDELGPSTCPNKPLKD